MACTVRGCRFPNTHVKSAHYCGTCHQPGHGQLECGNAGRIARIPEPYNFPIFACEIVGCTSPHTHETSAHTCVTCLNDTGRLMFGRHGPCNASLPRFLHLDCPHCKQPATVDTTLEIFVPNTECTICYSDTKMVLCTPCNHAMICKECAARCI